MGGVSIVFIICNILGLLNCILAIMVAIFALTDVDHSVRWHERDDNRGCDINCNPWLRNLNPFFSIAIFCVFVIGISLIAGFSELCLLIFKKNYFVRWIFRFLKYLEGHALFYLTLGVLLLGLSGNSGILIGSYVMVIGLIMLIVALVIRIASGGSAGRGQYGLVRCSGGGGGGKTSG